MPALCASVSVEKHQDCGVDVASCVRVAGFAASPLHILLGGASFMFVPHCSRTCLYKQAISLAALVAFAAMSCFGVRGLGWSIKETQIKKGLSELSVLGPEFLDEAGNLEAPLREPSLSKN